MDDLVDVQKGSISSCTFLGAFVLLVQAASELLQEDFHS